MRKTDYAHIVCSVYRRTICLKDREGKDRQAWQRAATLLRELNQRYHDVFGEWIEANEAPRC